jgi:hypothetical protein
MISIARPRRDSAQDELPILQLLLWQASGARTSPFTSNSGCNSPGRGRSETCGSLPRSSDGESLRSLAEKSGGRPRCGRSPNSPGRPAGAGLFDAAEAQERVTTQAAGREQRRHADLTALPDVDELIEQHVGARGISRVDRFLLRILVTARRARERVLLGERNRGAGAPQRPGAKRTGRGAHRWCEHTDRRGPGGCFEAEKPGGAPR